MAIIKVGALDLPAPSDMLVGIQDLVDAARNAKGNMMIEFINTKAKISLQWKYLSQTQLSSVLTAIRRPGFSVTYTDPETNATRTATFYVSDRNTGIMDVQGGVIRYQDVKFDFIEM